MVQKELENGERPGGLVAVDAGGNIYAPSRRPESLAQRDQVKSVRVEKALLTPAARVSGGVQFAEKLLHVERLALVAAVIASEFLHTQKLGFCDAADKAGISTGVPGGFA
ncbi:MAG: hypothetical protein HY301_05785 [Verrucomicrobia bacterium]|nr:hypothetical protein [Verrucomicrobiota bacterium]